jgi:DNA repair protein SbcD/Mre11
VKFVHAADVHLDSPLYGLLRHEGAPGGAMGATRRALAALVTLCIEEQASFLLLGGDLVDATGRDYKTGLFFVQEMLRLRDADIPVFSVRGNHDAESRVMTCLALPENVTELGLLGPETVVIDELGVAIHGQSYRERAATDNLAARYPPPIAGALNLGLLHTSVDGRPGHDTYAPCGVTTLRSLGYAYWALGHVHAREVLGREPWIVFPGNLQGRSLREAGPKGATVVTTAGGHIEKVEHRPLDVVRFSAAKIDVSEAASLDDILGRVVRELEPLLADDDERLHAVSVVLDGAPGVGALLSHAPEQCLRAVRHVARDLAPERLYVAEVWAEGAEPLQGGWSVGALHSSPRRLRAAWQSGEPAAKSRQMSGRTS